MSNPKANKTAGLIYVIAGKEASQVNARCQELLEKLLEPSERATGLFSTESAGVSAYEVLDELRTAPFLTERRVVVVKSADDFISENRQLLEKYFDKPCPTGILVLTVTNWDARTKLAKKLAKVGTLISVTQPKAWQLPHRLIEYTREAQGKKITKDAAELLIELAGENLPRLYSEIDKLATFADTEKVIHVRHIESLIGHNRIFGAFSVIDACLASNIAQAVDRLRNMFAEDRTAEYTVVGAFAFHFRRMFNAKVLLERDVRPAEISKRLRIWGNKDSFFEQLRKMTLKQIGENLKQLAATDYAIKTGQAKAEVAIEQLVLRMTAGCDTR
jgi:DNA polymerase-3 subunit delta